MGGVHSVPEGSPTNSYNNNDQQQSWGRRHELIMQQEQTVGSASPSGPSFFDLVEAANSDEAIEFNEILEPGSCSRLCNQLKRRGYAVLTLSEDGRRIVDELQTVTTRFFNIDARVKDGFEWDAANCVGYRKDDTTEEFQFKWNEEEGKFPWPYVTQSQDYEKYAPLLDAFQHCIESYYFIMRNVAHRVIKTIAKNFDVEFDIFLDILESNELSEAAPIETIANGEYSCSSVHLMRILPTSSGIINFIDNMNSSSSSSSTCNGGGDDFTAVRLEQCLLTILPATASGRSCKVLNQETGYFDELSDPCQVIVIAGTDIEFITDGHIASTPYGVPKAPQEPYILSPFIYKAKAGATYSSIVGLVVNKTILLKNPKLGRKLRKSSMQRDNINYNNDASSLSSYSKMSMEDQLEKLTSLLKDEEFRMLFKLFSATELSVENILFWESVEKYKATHDERKRRDLAASIFARFIPPSAPLALNLPVEILTAVEENYSKAETNVFDVAQLCCEQFMIDTLMRFQRIYRINK